MFYINRLHIAQMWGSFHHHCLEVENGSDLGKGELNDEGRRQILFDAMLFRNYLEFSVSLKQRQNNFRKSFQFQ